MAAKINKSALGIISAKAFYTFLKSGIDDNSVYAGVSYIPDSDWLEYTGSSDSESTVLGGVDSEFDRVDETFFNQTMYSMHKVYPGGISRVIPRKDWKYGEVYGSYGEENNYVLVKEYVSGYARLNVYQCLFTPRTPSIYAPTGTSQSAFTLSDDYVWKYMYTIQNSEAIRFLNSKWMPVAEKISTSAAAEITSGSTNYEQYIAQINAEAGELYSVYVDSDSLFAEMTAGLDSDLRVSFNWGSVDLIARDVATNTPTKYMKMKLSWDAATSQFTTQLTESGSGYVGPVTFGMDSDSYAIQSISALIAPGSGHSSDPPKELGANNIMVSVRNISDENSAPIFDNCKYNLVSLHFDPLDTSTNELATDEVYITCPYFEIEGTNPFMVGDVIKPYYNDDGRRFEIISVYSGITYYVPTKDGKSMYVIGDSEVISDTSGAKIVTVKTSYSRNITLNSSDTVIADRKDTTVTRENGQIETFNFVLTF